MDIVVKKNSRKKKREKNRAQKKYVKFAKEYLSKIVPGSYVIDCRMHPCVVTEVDYCYGPYWPEDFEAKSLLNGVWTSCSTRHCGPEIITKEQAEHMVKVFKEKDFYEMLKVGGYSDAEVEQYKELDKTWNFDKGEKTPYRET